MVTAEVTTEVVMLTNGGNLPFFDFLVFALGVTAITFIAIILLLDNKVQKEPVALPDKESS